MDRNVLTVCDEHTGPVTLDPHKEFDGVSHDVVIQIFEGLISFSPEGKLEPALATDWERIDPTRIRFKLRRGVLFHNGEKFDARAVKFSFDRALSPFTLSPAAFILKNVQRAEIVDDYTIDVVTKAPDGVVLNKLALAMLVIPPEYFKKMRGKTFARLPVGTGPFKFISWEKGKEIILEKNENYWRAGHPRIDGLIFKQVPIEKQTEALLAGELDMVHWLAEKDTLRVQENAAAKVLKKDAFLICAAIFNNKKAPLSDKRVRLALNYAINKQDIIDYALKGNGRAISTFAMPGETGYSELAPYPFDLNKARELLAAAGYPNGFKLKVMISDMAAGVGRMALKQLEMIGIKSEYEVVNQQTEVRRLALPTIIPLLPRWNGDLLISQINNPMCHTFFPYGIAIHSKGPYSAVKHAEFDRLFDEMVSEIEPGRQALSASKLNLCLHDEALTLLVFQLKKVYGLRKTIDFPPNITGMLDFRTASKGGA